MAMNKARQPTRHIPGLGNKIWNKISQAATDLWLILALCFSASAAAPPRQESSQSGLSCFYCTLSDA